MSYHFVPNAERSGGSSNSDKFIYTTINTQDVSDFNSARYISGGPGNFYLDTLGENNNSYFPVCGNAGKYKVTIDDKVFCNNASYDIFMFALDLNSFLTGEPKGFRIEDGQTYDFEENYGIVLQGENMSTEGNTYHMITSAYLSIEKVG